MTESLQIERQGAVARVWLNRPEVRNAFDETLIAAMTRAFQAFSADDSLRAIVIGGAARRSAPAPTCRG